MKRINKLFFPLVIVMGALIPIFSVTSCTDDAYDDHAEIEVKSYNEYLAYISETKFEKFISDKHPKDYSNISKFPITNYTINTSTPIISNNQVSTSKDMASYMTAGDVAALFFINVASLLFMNNVFANINPNITTAKVNDIKIEISREYLAGEYHYSVDNLFIGFDQDLYMHWYTTKELNFFSLIDQPIYGVDLAFNFRPGTYNSSTNQVDTDVFEFVEKVFPSLPPSTPTQENMDESLVCNGVFMIFSGFTFENN
jgi:hypothetical protein